MKEYIGCPGTWFLRRVFSLRTEAPAILRISGDPQRYLKEFCLPLRGDGHDGDWLMGGSFLKFRVWVDGVLIGCGPFRSATDGVRVEHEFMTEKLTAGPHVLAIVFRSEENGISAEMESSGGITLSPWKIRPGGAHFASGCPRHPNLHGYFKGDIGPGESFEDLEGNEYPDGWKQAGYDDSSWSPAEEKRLDLPTEKAEYNFVFEEKAPESLRRTSDGRWIIDFGDEAIGSIRLRGPRNGGYVEVRLGEEMFSEDRVRYEFREFMVCYQEMWNFRPGGQFLEHFGLREFRYAELAGYGDTLSTEDIRMIRVRAPFREDCSILRSPDETLNRIWDLCKYTIKATSADLYTDCFHRERNAYEADALLTMLAQFAVSGDTQVAARTLGFLVTHPTWPLEWRLLLPHLFHVWYWETGDLDLVRKHYSRLIEYCSFPDLVREGMVRRFPGRVLVDWPESFRAQFDGGDGEYWLPPNALFARTLSILAELGDALGHDTRTLRADHERLVGSIQEKCLRKDGLYRDRPESDHVSIYGNLWALWSGCVPEEQSGQVADFLEECGMNCSLYSAFFYLDALFRYGKGRSAYGFLTGEGPYGWKPMLEAGLTLTSEYWYDPEKRMSLAHPWGAYPAWLVLRHVFGLRPTSPGWKTYVVEPADTPLKGSGAELSVVKNGETIRVVI